MDKGEWEARRELAAVKLAMIANQRILAKMQEQLFAYMERDVKAEADAIGSEWKPDAATARADLYKEAEGS